MRKFIVGVALLATFVFGVTAKLGAQGQAREYAAATLSAANAACNANNCVNVGLGVFKTVSVQLTGTCGTCTLQFEVSNDGTNYVSVNMLPISGTQTAVTSVTAVGIWSGQVPTTYFRVRMSALSSGSFVVKLRAVL